MPLLLAIKRGPGGQQHGLASHATVPVKKWQVQLPAGRSIYLFFCVQKLVNHDPPLVHKFSNPVKVRLTPEGESLAARLYAIALTAGEVEHLPGFDLIETLAEAARAAPAESPPAPKVAPKRKEKAAQTAKSSAGTAATNAESGGALVPAAEDVSVLADKPSGRGVGKSMRMKLAAVAQKKPKRKRFPLELEDFPDSPKGWLFINVGLLSCVVATPVVMHLAPG